MATDPPLITDAAPSFDVEQARRRRTYVVIMVVHLVGFAGSYPAYLWHPWAGAALVIATGLLPWVAVIVANGAPHPRARRPPPGPALTPVSPTGRRPIGTSGAGPR